MRDHLNLHTIVVAMLWLVFSAAGAESSRIRTLKISGKVEISRDKGHTWSFATSNQTFRRSWELAFRTGSNSYIDVQLADGSLIRLTENSIVWIDKSVEEGGVSENQLDIRNGRMVCVSLNTNLASKFEIKTTAGVCGVRSTETNSCQFDVTGDFKVRCVSGKVVQVYVVAGVVIPPLTVNSGERSEIGKDTRWVPVARRMDPVELATLVGEINELRQSAIVYEKNGARRLPSRRVKSSPAN